jgi:hypothetical protein
MAEADMYKFSHKEVVEALIKQQGIHDGLWSLYIEFGIAAANMNMALQPAGQAIAAPSDADALTPAAIVPVVSIGLIRSANLNRLTVDAGEVNPPSKTG